MLMHFVQDVCDTKEGQSSRGLEPAMPGAFPSDWQHLKRFFNTNHRSQGQPNCPLHGGFSRQALQGESPTCVGLRCQVKLISNVQIPEILRCSSVSIACLMFLHVSTFILFHLYLYAALVPQVFLLRFTNLVGQILRGSTMWRCRKMEAAS